VKCLSIIPNTQHSLIHHDSSSTLCYISEIDYKQLLLHYSTHASQS